ncbi:alpha/beta fold hydrolase [Agrococcus carbonis]|uniref:Pimeloyl-ACP methyl ester carboxylesterase n=1 Tax=Agrococcus carbonis TaxID=684552 RepID=A0A1H1NPQ3_9MICO|nr:alpha/beta fold hydrolase [Agrococcus carbonis]SDS00967.1 Pimeloyl-ACP methyl ester carboxylesterase [Agrococcus carbonis]
MSDLHTTTLGEQGSPVVFCHGLFGQGKNWTQIGKALAASHRVTLVDMPDHGQSPWSERLDYEAMADAVAGVIDEPAALVGHSMGGKAAMLAALRHPERVERLVVVDVSPVQYRSADEFRGFIDAMLGMDLGAIGSRADADAALADAVPNPGVRAFLLQSLRREADGWRWLPNLEMLRRDLDVLRGFPETDAVYEGPVLWIGGSDSGYVRDEFVPAMEARFPRVRRVTIKGAGHWVHSEQPKVFTEVLSRFLDA